jgi:hypothetical protein
MAYPVALLIARSESPSRFDGAARHSAVRDNFLCAFTPG